MFWRGRRTRCVICAAFRMATVVLPEPAPPVTRRCPLAAKISSCFSVSCIRTDARLGTHSGRSGGRAAVGTSSGSGRTGGLQSNAGVPKPLRYLRLAALGEVVGDAPVGLRPAEVVTERSGRCRFHVQIGSAHV